jgi:hypothetical protein
MHHFLRDLISSSICKGVTKPRATNIKRGQPIATIPVAQALLKRSWTFTANHNEATHPTKNMNVATDALTGANSVRTVRAITTHALGITNQMALMGASGAAK